MIKIKILKYPCTINKNEIIMNIKDKQHVTGHVNHKVLVYTIYYLEAASESGRVLFVYFSFLL